MPQYMLSVHYVDGEGATQRTIDETPEVDSEAEMQKAFERVEQFNQKLQAEGVWVFAGGLMPIDQATTVDNTGEKPIVTDGPYAESKEYLGGFWVIKATDLDAALQWAKEASHACQGKVEVRSFQGE